MARPRKPGKRYGIEHQKARERALRAYRPGLTRCARGGEVLTEQDTSLLHMDHADDGNGYLGLSCARHNIGARNTLHRTRPPKPARELDPEPPAGWPVRDTDICASEVWGVRCEYGGAGHPHPPGRCW